MAASGVSIPSYLRLVRENANFRRLWLAQMVNENGDWFYTLAIYGLLLDFTGKASSAALDIYCWGIPPTSGLRLLSSSLRMQALQRSGCFPRHSST